MLGVYELIVVLDGDEPRRTSLAREPELAEADEQLAHPDCADTSSDALPRAL